MVYEQNVVSSKKTCAKRVKHLWWIPIAIVVGLFLVYFQNLSIWSRSTFIFHGKHANWNRSITAVFKRLSKNQYQSYVYDGADKRVPYTFFVTREWVFLALRDALLFRDSWIYVFYAHGNSVSSLLRSRYENATPNLCWVFCALLGVLCN